MGGSVAGRCLVLLACLSLSGVVNGRSLRTGCSYNEQNYGDGEVIEVDNDHCGVIICISGNVELLPTASGCVCTSTRNLNFTDDAEDDDEYGFQVDAKALLRAPEDFQCPLNGALYWNNARPLKLTSNCLYVQCRILAQNVYVLELKTQGGCTCEFTTTTQTTATTTTPTTTTTTPTTTTTTPTTTTTTPTTTTTTPTTTTTTPTTTTTTTPTTTTAGPMCDYNGQSYANGEIIEGPMNCYAVQCVEGIVQLELQPCCTPCPKITRKLNHEDQEEEEASERQQQAYRCYANNDPTGQAINSRLDKVPEYCVRINCVSGPGMAMYQLERGSACECPETTTATTTTPTTTTTTPTTTTTTPTTTTTTVSTTSTDACDAETTP